MEERNHYMSRATAVLCPTQYIEPFNCVAVEAQLCGTPVISTDWGGFTETVEQGVSGFRCNYLGEFVDAIAACKDLSPRVIRDRAVSKYSLEAVQVQYKRYFTRLQYVWEKGWYTTQNLRSDYAYR